MAEDPSKWVILSNFTTSKNLSSRTHFSHLYMVENGIIQYIYAPLPLGRLNMYTLSDMLATYGAPDEIWITTYQNYYCNEGLCTLPFGIVLFYADQNFILDFWSRDEGVREDSVMGCINSNDYASSLGVWAPGTVVDFRQATTLFQLDAYELFLPIDQVTDMDINDFYEVYRKPNRSNCLETPTSLWPGQ